LALFFIVSGWVYRQSAGGQRGEIEQPLRNPTTRNHQLVKTMNINISFSPEGTAQCLWTEALPLHELGRLEITRASNIEFNNTTQHWEVKDRRGKVRFIARSRSACLEWEQQNLQVE
jgi:hypothetical protein